MHNTFTLVALLMLQFIFLEIQRIL